MWQRRDVLEQAIEAEVTALWWRPELPVDVEVSLVHEQERFQSRKDRAKSVPLLAVIAAYRRPWRTVRYQPEVLGDAVDWFCRQEHAVCLSFWGPGYVEVLEPMVEARGVPVRRWGLPPKRLEFDVPAGELWEEVAWMPR